MTRYFFHLQEGGDLTEDREGRDLPDEAAAYEEAVRGIRSILCEDLAQGRLDLRGSLIVADGSGGVLFRIAFDEAVELVVE